MKHDAFLTIGNTLRAKVRSKAKEINILSFGMYGFFTLNTININKNILFFTNITFTVKTIKRLFGFKSSSSNSSSTRKQKLVYEDKKFKFKVYSTEDSFFGILKWLIVAIFWLKARISYYTNNWIYTTNHKRIAVNYFWFVILSGIVGMVLATIIRLEFAYPGVGVLAGDSIQYLSLASAHGVIMVFFMIMPLLFGAFANFLLPTQLGVHDVAFPRLNSAAFWFLPGGLLMLCQLVCVDRRYQRMNCFNIREAESLLKRRFFTDLINSKDQHLLLNKTAIGLRFKLNGDSSLRGNLNNLYNFGLEINPQVRSSTYFNIISDVMDFENIRSFQLNSYFFKLISYFNSTNIFFLLNSICYFFLEKNFLNTIGFVAHLNTSYLYSFFFFILNKISYVFKLTIGTIYFSIVNVFAFFINVAKDLFYLISEIGIHAIFFWTTRVFAFFYKLVLICDNMYEYLKYLIVITRIKVFYFYLLYWPSYRDIGDFFNSFDKRLINFFNSCLKYLGLRLRSLEKFYLKLEKETIIDTELLRFEINYNFGNNNFFFNFYNILKITLNNWFACFSKENVDYRVKCMFSDNPEIPVCLNPKSGPIAYRNLLDKALLPAYKESFMLEVYSFIYLILNLPLLVINFLFYLTGCQFTNLFNHNMPHIPGLKGQGDITKVYHDFIFWSLNTIKGTNVWHKKSTILDSFELRYLILKGITSGPKIILRRLTSIVTSYYNSAISWALRVDREEHIYKSVLSDFTAALRIELHSFFSKLLESYTQYCNELQKILIVQKNSKTYSAFYNFYSFFVNNRFISFISSKFFFKKFNTTAHVDVNSVESFLLNNEELSNNSRFLRFNNPIFKYDYKSGDYFPKLYKDLYSFLIPSILDLTSGLRTPSWFFSSALSELLEINLGSLIDNLEKKTNFKSFNAFPNKTNKITHSDLFYNFFFSLNNSENDFNLKWISTNTLNTKFNRMFLTSSMQQRMYTNWRNLKFTREAWRCKMLLARHQKTLFRRYLHEDGVFWSIERNAKDLIPGWAMITPFSSRTRYTAVGKTDIGLMGVLLVLNSSIISGANFLVTYRYLSTLNNRKMRDARAFFTEAVMVASWMMILANPMLVIGIIMLISDRHWQTSFFDYSGGGDTVLFQHMFWFFGHPEVYIIIIPTFGFTNTMMSYYLKKRVSARASLLYSLYTIAFLGFFVWGHHMYMVGLSHTTRMLFSTLTVMISVPAATKIMHWCVTTANSAFAMELPLLFTFTFIFFFVSGGISGMCVAHTGMDVLFHDTFYVIGHFHVMLAGGAMFASFGAFYFYFPAIFGVKYSRIYAYLHYSYYLIGQLMTVIPMFWLGYAGMPRRVLDYPAAFGGWHSVISAGHMLNVAGLMAFFIMIFDSLRQAKAATRNTFGVSRYNTRLNFYIYEISRLIYLQQKSFYAYRVVRPHSLKLNKLNYTNWEPYETVLFSYVLIKN